MNEKLTIAHQLALDYCCTPDEVLDDRHHFTIHTLQAGRRRFQEDGICPLRIAAVNGKLLFTGREDVISFCQEQYANANAPWFMDACSLMKMQEDLRALGCSIDQARPFFTTANITQDPAVDFCVQWYERAEIEQFRGDHRFGEAYAFCPDAPDELGVAAIRDGEIIGMAGASGDSPLLWQLGIDVLPAHRGRHVASALVTLLKNEVLRRGKLPYYGTGTCHVASQRVALHAGFLPAWYELVTVQRPRPE